MRFAQGDRVQHEKYGAGVVVTTVLHDQSGALVFVTSETLDVERTRSGGGRENFQVDVVTCEFDAQRDRPRRVPVEELTAAPA